MSDDQDVMQELGELRQEVQRLKDVHEITQLKARNSRCVVTKDWAGYGDTLTDDYELVVDGGAHTGREEVVSFVTRTLADATTVLDAHSEEITITGPETASAIWVRHAYVIMPGTEPRFALNTYGHYHEDYVRTDDGWKLRRTVETTVHVDMQGPPPG